MVRTVVPHTIRDALRLVVQTAMLLVATPIVIRNLWRFALFPHDEQPWLMTAVLMIVAILPVSMWWREATGSAAATKIEVILSSLAAIAGFLLFVGFAAWVGFLSTGPYSGPMAIEATLFSFIACCAGAAGSALLMVAPLNLDPALFTATFRRSAWKAIVVGLPTAAVLALLAGPHLSALFR
ncbi:MAG TPA: hypothetical protein VEU30_08685 [Thermoanaerobaculia bacterium]|nr:hypothetical protein [Thermoanaerobaculia bacterium]